MLLQHDTQLVFLGDSQGFGGVVLLYASLIQEEPARVGVHTFSGAKGLKDLLELGSLLLVVVSPMLLEGKRRRATYLDLEVHRLLKGLCVSPC